MLDRLVPRTPTWNNSPFTPNRKGERERGSGEGAGQATASFNQRANALAGSAISSTDVYQ